MVEEKDAIFNDSSLIKVDNTVIENIKNKARIRKKGRFRLCLHHSSEDELHEMIIVRNRGDYCRPDKHLNTTESQTIIEGAMLVILFEDNGDIREVFELSKKCYCTYRIDRDNYHMQIPITEQAVYYETRQGPFTERSNIYPEWAPKTEDEDAIEQYMTELKHRIIDLIPEFAEKLDER